MTTRTPREAAEAAEKLLPKKLRFVDTPFAEECFVVWEAALDDFAATQRDRCEALVKAEWIKVKPDENAQRLRAEITLRFPDDELPDWAWSFLDIGIALASAAAERRGYDAGAEWMRKRCIKEGISYDFETIGEAMHHMNRREHEYAPTSADDYCLRCGRSRNYNVSISSERCEG